MSNSDVRPPRRIAVIGGGPAGLFAAERLRAAGLDVDLYEAKGSPGRKFLIAGKGGLNLTHSDPRPLFDSRYREQATRVGRWLDGFDAQALRDWAAGFGVETYVGSSGRVFPVDRKAAPLLRGWVRRLKEQGVRLHVNHRWLGWSDDGALRFATDNGELEVRADATVLALGGGSWPQLGSDGAWVPTLQARAVDIAPLQSANCGFDVAWTPFFAQRHAGAPLKPVVAHWHGLDGEPHTLQGECVASEYGIEGSLIYALSADLRETLNRDGHATLWLDLVPGRDEARLLADLSQPRKGRSFGEHLRRQTGLDPVKTALVFETLGKDAGNDLAAVIATLKRLPLRLLRPRPMAEVISTAGGVRLDALDEGLMLRALPGVFCAGEMLDWEAPTGGYLLTACYASGLRAAEGVTAWLATR
ncbi:MULTISPECIES: TIGR03862 family flavoprotein [Stenotrophomonas]|uniref:TIGR03862 family flavoprotein n=1 Tax=Stenotrophomonas TaxID=40323 RepID=UPI001C4EB97C|nr:TIGR03862 family flavoprotein [Stenotrophomonas indicatrix]QXQ03986.1 TIGR03862 family flavoprotein [Stenotrophomonas indicatrix]